MMRRLLTRRALYLGLGLLVGAVAACETDQPDDAQPAAAVPSEGAPSAQPPVASPPGRAVAEQRAEREAPAAPTDEAPPVAAPPPLEGTSAELGSRGAGGAGGGAEDALGGLGGLDPSGLGERRVARSSVAIEAESHSARGPHPAQLTWTTIEVTGELNERVAELPIQQKRRQLWACYTSNAQDSAAPAPGDAVVALDSEGGVAANVTITSDSLPPATLACVEGIVRSFEFTRSGYFEFRLSFAMALDTTAGN